MEKEKQIEEMIKTMSVYIPTPDDEIRAKLLYAAGYRNVKEAVKELAERVKGIFSGNAEERQKGYEKEIGCFLTVGEFNEEIDELIKEVCGEK